MLQQQKLQDNMDLIIVQFRKRQKVNIVIKDIYIKIQIGISMSKTNLQSNKQNFKYMETPKDIKLKPTTKIININDKIDYFQSWLNFKQRVNGREKK